MKLLSLLQEISLHPKNAEELKGLIRKLAIKGIFSNSSDDWKKIPLIELGDWAIGTGFPLVEQGLQGQEILFAKVSDMNLIGNEKHILTTNNSISYDTAKRIRAKIHGIGTVIFPKIGGAIATNKRRVIKKPTIIDNNCLGITPNDNTSVDWLLLVLASIDFTEYQSGTSVPSLSQKIIGEIEVTQPPLEEQKAIVEVVNALFKEVEALEELTKERISLKEDFVTSALRRLTETDNTTQEWNYLKQHFSSFFTEKKNITSLRETILQLAVQGKLTAKWREKNPSVENASELLKRIEAEKQQLIAEKKIRREKAFPRIKDDEKEFNSPNGWMWCRFQQIFDIRDGTHDSPKDSSETNSYPLITSKNFKEGNIDFDSARRISEADYLKVIYRSKVHTGDILFSMIGGNIGNQVEVGDYTEFAIKNVALFKHYNSDTIAKGFLSLFSKFIAMSLQSHAAGGAQPFVSLKFFRNLVLGLPPLKEQQAIVEKVNSLMSLCDELEQQIDNSQTQIEQLMQSCLKEVFEQ